MTSTSRTAPREHPPGTVGVRGDVEVFPGPARTPVETALADAVEDALAAVVRRERSRVTGLCLDQVDHVAPGPELAQFLAGADLDAADDHALVEAVAAWKKVASWAEAQAARAAATLDERPSMNPRWPVSAGNVSVKDVTGEELAMRLGCSKRTARTMVNMGRAFASTLADTGQALEAGDIDVVKARILLEALGTADPETALDVQDRVLENAGRRTPDQLGKDVQRALIAADPTEAAERAKSAVSKRRVCRPKTLADGMAGMWAVLPAVQAVAIDAELEARARAQRTLGDGRTLDQLRADAFAAQLLPAELAGPAGLSAPNAPARPYDDDHPQPCPPTGTAETAPVGDVESSPEAEVETEAVDVAPEPEPDETTPETDESSMPDAPMARRRGRLAARPRINVTVPFDVLLGVSDDPAELEGYGAITAEAARLLAVDGTWRRILTDPASGTVLDVGRTQYRPPAALAEHIRVRDRRCSRPGCSAAALTCDIDHTIEYTRADGTTAHTNLGPLCARDHQIKTDGGFTLTQPEPGTFVWRTPTGHVYRTRPGDDGRYEVLQRGRPPDERRRDGRAPKPPPPPEPEREPLSPSLPDEPPF